ncbi:PepSY domain-containing protein [Planococcus sp. FY231025]|uniref:PepSY domain-containing protein n=1 Tax=Planococcus sp. FY231025 TaxID=3455699 RepID=UPI003F90590C
MKKWMLMAIATVLLGAVAAAYLLYPRPASEAVDAQQAEEAVTSVYGGKIEKTILEGEHFKVEFVREDGRYIATVNRGNGDVEKVEALGGAAPEEPERLTEEQAGAIAAKETGGTVEGIRYLKDQEEYEVRLAGEAGGQIVILSSVSGEIRKITPVAETAKPEPEPAPEPDPVLTEAQAIEIAKQTLDGEVQEVTFTDDSDGGSYLVEIENDQLDKEVTVQIHAVRGETLTVEWDD